MNIRYISAQLDQRLATLPNSPEVAWPNVPFTPSEDVYLRVNNLPADSSRLFMDSTQENLGVYQVSAVGPLGGGAGAVENAADAVKAHFAAQRKLGDVFVEAISIAPAVVTDDEYQVPVSINWRIFD